jgi:putative intracellular protease/amidase
LTKLLVCRLSNVSVWDCSPHHTVHAVCPGKKAGELVRTAIHDFEGDQTYSEKRGHNFVLNATFSEVKPEAYDGPSDTRRAGARILDLEYASVDVVRHFVQARKPIAAICHAAQLLAAARVLGGPQVQLLSRRFPGHRCCRWNVRGTADGQGLRGRQPGDGAGLACSSGVASGFS